MADHYDVIVLGVGGVGSSSLYYLARKGARVLGLEQFSIGHDRGSSHGETRAIRKAYFEHPDYVPLLERSYKLWQALESESGKQLLHLTGLLEIGPEDGVLIRGVRAAAEQHDLSLNTISREEFGDRFAGFVLPQNQIAVFEPDGGFLRVEDCIGAFVELALEHGAQLRTQERVLEWSSNHERIELITDQERYTADRLVVTAGAWTQGIIQSLGIRLNVLRKHLHWYRVPESAYLLEHRSPVFFYEMPNGYYYGFPQVGNSSTIKLAEHSGGEVLDDPSQQSSEVDPFERGRVEAFLRARMPDVQLKPEKHATCMYTMSPDEHFIVGTHPQDSRIALAAGLSGHGFKFASVLGEILADLATDQLPRVPIDFLSIDRFEAM